MRFTFVKKHPISFLSSLYICNLFVSTLATATLPENEQVVLPPNAFEVSQSMGTLQSSQAGKPAYRAVAGFFIQDHPDTIKEDFNYVCEASHLELTSNSGNCSRSTVACEKREWGNLLIPLFYTHR